MFATGRSFEDQLSAAQRGVWVAQKLNPASPIFNLGQYIEIRGEIDAELLRRALFQVVEEAPSLRIAIRDWNGEPSQKVRPSDLVDIPIVDFSASSDAVAEAQQWMRDDLRTLVDLGRDHLFRFAILRISPRRAFWYQRYHHIANDGFGGWLLARRAADVYTALSDGKLPAETPFALLTELLADERDYRASDQFASDRKYWMERLAGAEDPPRLCPAAVGTAAVPIRRTAYLARPLTARYARSPSKAGLPSHKWSRRRWPPISFA